MTKISKYFCLCGEDFQNKADAHMHIALTENLKGHWHHKLHRLKLRSLIWHNFFAGKQKTYLKLAGCFLVFGGLMHHFGVELTPIEALLVGGGIGLLV